MRPYRKKRELANWVRRSLGSPVVDVILDATQLDDCIDAACDYFGEFAGGIGNQESILLISPEQVFYDGTGNASKPVPERGRWRKPTTTPGSSGCGTMPPSSCGPSGCPPPIDSATPGMKFGGEDGNPTTNFPLLDADGNCCPEETLPGPGWCGTNIQAPQCFTEIGEYDPTAIGPFWVEGDTTAKPLWQGPVWRSVYPVPSDVIAVSDNLPKGFFGGFGGNNEDNALFSPFGQLLQAGGSWGMQSPGSSVDNRWGFWTGSGGGFVDIVGFELAMQYLEMFRQIFTIKLTAQLIHGEHKVRLVPPPCDRGVIAFTCTRRTHDEFLYEAQWVRNYSTALAMIYVGMNVSKYEGMTMPGGGSINGAMYLQRGDALREKLEAQINEGMFSEPCDFFVG